VIAGSIFTFSLSLGDYITVEIVGGKTQLLGNVVYRTIGAGNNLPFRGGRGHHPVVIMVVYLLAVRRSARWRSCEPRAGRALGPCVR